MSGLEAQQIPLVADPALRIHRLIVGRLAVIILILLTGLWWVASYRTQTVDAYAVRAFLLFFVSTGLAVIYLFVLYMNRSYVWQVRAQFLIDVAVITVIVAETGNVISPYTTLYLVLIGVAGLFLNKVETILIALLSAFGFSAVAVVSLEQMWVRGESFPSGLMQILSFNSIGILIVGLLAGHLSDRRKFRNILRETTESFTDLRVLHQSIVESIRSGLITADLNGTIHTFNRAAAVISGTGPAEMIGRGVHAVFDEEVRPLIDGCLNQAAEGQTFPTRHFEAVIRNGGGENGDGKTTVACSVLPLVGKTGHVGGLIFTFQDVTEIRAMEETLRRSDRLAAVGRMAAGLAHEIRNPLGSMSSALQFLQGSAVPAAGSGGDLIDVALRESERLDRIIANFLTYANPSADAFASGEFGEVDIRLALDECLTLLRHSPELHETHHLRPELPDGPVLVRANETQIKQVFWNLLRNALQAMPDGGTLRVSLREFPGRSVRLTFEDTGCGIGAEKITHLFEPFTSHNGGTGLGLSIVRRIVHGHGGGIDVYSRENEGTRIVVELPSGARSGVADPEIEEN